MSNETPDGRSTSRSPRQVNASIERFLDYYLIPDRKLDYAVLISGPWGSGKSYLVKGFLKKTTAKPLYVSLYGMTSTSQIEDEFYRQLHPVLSHPGMRVLGALGKGLLKGTLKIDLDGDNKDDGTLSPTVPDLDLRKGLDDPRGRLLVFDDLERCRIPVGEVLGFINAYVEHDGLKAIIIANETKVMEDDPTYVEIREKLIGQRLEVAPEADAAFEAFLELIEDTRTRKFLADQHAKILELHAIGGRGNLRTLKHAMWDFEKIAAHLRDDHWQHADAMNKLADVVMATSMELRAGAMGEDDLKQLIGHDVGRMVRMLGTEATTTPADEIDARYQQIDFNKVVLPAEVLAAMLFRGDVDGEALRAAIDDSAFFLKPDEQPLWLRAINVYSATDDEADATVAEVNLAFAEGRIKDRGELMHLLGTRLWWAKIDLIPSLPSRVLSDGLAYIARLDESGQIDPIGRDAHDRDNAFHGYRVMESETPEFRSFAAAYRDADERKRCSAYLATAHSLMARYPSESRDVELDMVSNNVRTATYAADPVLAALPPEFFVQLVLGQRPDLQTELLELVHSRNESRQRRLKPERDWAMVVESQLKERLQHLHPMTRERLRSAIARNLTPLRDSDTTSTT